MRKERVTMKYPKLLNKYDTIGVCAPSSGVQENLWGILDNAELNVKRLGYKIIETESIRRNIKCVSNDSEIRAKEFMRLYSDNDVKVILPPWGGEFLMDMLPYLDFEEIKGLKPKWIVGYSDTTTLTFVLTVLCDIATIHGSNLMNMGFKEIHKYDLNVFDVIGKEESIQYNSEKCGGFTDTFDAYKLDKETEYKNLNNENMTFDGMIIGGCMDVLCKLIGTKYAPVNNFLEKYKDNCFIWTLESCEMNAGDIYRTLWQMKECGWFKYCNGIIIGRPDGYSDTKDFTIKDALEKIFYNIPVIYDADIGHVPPQLQLINGSYAKVEYDSNGKFSIHQKMDIK